MSAVAQYFIGMGTLLALCLLGSAWWNNMQCDNRWPTVIHKYSITTGCMIDPNRTGIYIPEANYRVL